MKAYKDHSLTERERERERVFREFHGNSNRNTRGLTGAINVT